MDIQPKQKVKTHVAKEGFFTVRRRKMTHQQDIKELIFFFTQLEKEEDQEQEETHTKPKNNPATRTFFQWCAEHLPLLSAF
jgi:hypothetical protein